MIYAEAGNMTEPITGRKVKVWGPLNGLFFFSKERWEKEHR
jgi:hypothetical protein